MRRPILNKHHVACKYTSRIGSASRVRLTPEHDSAVLVRRVSEDLVQANGKAVQVSNVQWAKIRVEAVVEEFIVAREVCRRVSLGTCLRFGLGRALF